MSQNWVVPARVLVTGVGGAAGVGFIRALGAEPQLMFAADMDVYAAGLYLVPAERRLVVPAGGDERFAPTLLELCRRNCIDVLVPTVDAELLPIARAREAFERQGTRVVLASEATLALCLDKRRLLEVCVGEIPVPRFATYDADFRTEGWRYPLVVKPRTGSGGRGVQVVRSRAELDAIPRDSAFLVQEHLPGAEYSVDVFANAEGEVLAVVPRERLKVDSGVAVASRTFHDAELERLALLVARRIHLTYVANIQFRRDRLGVPSLLEVNPRFPGTMALTVASGINMPLLALREALGLPLPPGGFRFSELAMVRFWEELFIEPRAVRGLERARERLATHAGMYEVA